MPIVLTGAKYNTTLSSAGTTTVTASSANFIAGDFSVARRVDLYNSAGTTFKGTAFVRRRISATQLQLESEFFNPLNGNIATQAVGDNILVSQNWNDVAQTNITISGQVVTVSDTITFGTIGSLTSIAFHDENKFIVNTITGPLGARIYDVAGGFLTFGHLQNYQEKITYNGCTFKFNNTINANSFTPLSTAARMCFWGGAHLGSGANPIYYASGFTTVPYGTDWGFLWSLNVNFENTDVLSVNAGGNWTTGANHILEQSSFVGNGFGLILVRFGNGIIKNCLYKITDNSNLPISIFGTDTAGTYEIAADPGARSIVLDMGNGPALVRNGTNITNTFNFYNLVTTDFRIMTGFVGSLTPNNNGTVNIFFRDAFTNLVSDSLGLVILDSNGSIVDSVLSSGTTWTPAVLRRRFVGATQQFLRGPWSYGIKAYGRNPISGTINPSNFSLGTAGTADNVAFGGLVNQLVDSNVTLSRSAAAALSDISTLDQLYDAIIAWSVANTTNAQYPTLGSYAVTGNGTTLNFGSRNLVFNPSAGSAVSINTGTNTITIKANAAGLLAGTKFRRFTTTGTVTLQNGAFIEDDDGARWEAGGNTLFASRVTHTCLTGATPVSGVEVAYFDNGAVNRTYNLSRTAVTSLTSNGSGVATGYIVYRINSTTFTGHAVRARQYGYQLYEVPQAITGAAVTSNLLLTTDVFAATAEGTVAAYSGISVNYGTKTVTVTASRTLTQLYEFLMYSVTLQANIAQAQPVSTVNGTTYTWATDWTVAVGASGNVTELTKRFDFQGTGASTVTSGGVFEDLTGIKWDVGGTTYFGKHVYRNVKAITGGANQQHAVVAVLDENGNDRTYNTSRVLGGLTTDASGNVEGYYVYRIGATSYTLTEYIGLYGYEWSTLPVASTGTAIGSSGTFETVRLVTDPFVTLSRTAALALTGITVNTTTNELNGNAYTYSQIQDNIKARQTRVDDIQTGVRGYLSYYTEGRIFAFDGSFYTLSSGWLIRNTTFGGTLRNSRLELSTPGTYSLGLNNCTVNFEGAGTYDLRGATITTQITVDTITNATVTVQLSPGTTFTNNDPTNITVEASTAVVLTVNNVIAGSRIQIYNTTDNVELFNEIVPTTTFTGNYTYTANKNIRVRLMYVSGATVAYQWYQVTGTITAAGFSLNAAQVENTVYTTNGVDGSTVTECSVSGTTIRIFIDDPDNVTTAQRLYNWYQYLLFTATGIRDQDGAYITATDSTHYRFSNSMKIVNQDTSNPLNILGANIVPFSGPATNIFDLTNGASIALNFERVEGFAFSSGSGLSPAQDAKLMSLPSASEVWDTPITGVTVDGRAGKVLKDAKDKANLAAQLSA